MALRGQVPEHAGRLPDKSIGLTSRDRSEFVRCRPNCLCVSPQAPHLHQKSRRQLRRLVPIGANNEQWKVLALIWPKCEKARAIVLLFVSCHSGGRSREVLGYGSPFVQGSHFLQTYRSESLGHPGASEKLKSFLALLLNQRNSGVHDRTNVERRSVLQQVPA